MNIHQTAFGIINYKKEEQDFDDVYIEINDFSHSGRLANIFWDDNSWSWFCEYDNISRATSGQYDDLFYLNEKSIIKRLPNIPSKWKDNFDNPKKMCWIEIHYRLEKKDSKINKILYSYTRDIPLTLPVKNTKVIQIYECLENREELFKEILMIEFSTYKIGKCKVKLVYYLDDIWYVNDKASLNIEYSEDGWIWGNFDELELREENGNKILHIMNGTFGIRST